MPANAYFGDIVERQRMLKAHGLDCYPSGDDVLDYAMELSDKIDALYWSLGLAPMQDCRGRWHVLPLAPRTEEE